MPCLLMVEDSPMQIRAIMSYFELTDFDVECAERLADALERTRRGGVDAVLLDLSLPDSHGIDTYRQMQEAAGDTPIVILTSTDDEELALQMLREGAEDYLIKGEVNSSWVRRALSYAIERRGATTRRRQPRVAPLQRLHLTVEMADDVTLIRVNENKLVDGELIEQLARELFRLADDVHRKKFLLDFGEVDYLANSALGQLMAWDRKIRKRGGAMRIFGLRPEVKDQMRVRRMLAQFDICIDKETALQGI